MMTTGEGGLVIELLLSLAKARGATLQPTHHIFCEEAWTTAHLYSPVEQSKSSRRLVWIEVELRMISLGHHSEPKWLALRCHLAIHAPTLDDTVRRD
jgi:hypothetical protein